MENKINIAEILRDCPQGTKLYSPLFGKCEFVGVDTGEGDESIRVEPFCGGVSRTFSSEGRYFERYQDADCVLFPSDKMRCWSKFFKRGDVLVDEDLETMVVFDGWANEDYTEFNTAIDHYKISDKWGEEDICCTGCFRKVTDEERAEFIAAAKKHYGGKYNPETLQVEPVKARCPFEPFQKVLVRNDIEDTWSANYFSHYLKNTDYHYACMNTAYRYCVAYEGNEHLLGTNNRPKTLTV